MQLVTGGAQLPGRGVHSRGASAGSFPLFVDLGAGVSSLPPDVGPGVRAVQLPGGLLPGYAGVSSTAILAYFATTASDSLEELVSLLERLNSLLGELDSLGEVLGAEGLSRGFIAPLDWDEELDSLLETLDSFCEEPTSLRKVLDSLGILSLVVPLDSQGESSLQGWGC